MFYSKVCLYVFRIVPKLFVNKCFVICRYNKSEMCMVKIKSVEHLNSLPKTKWNISQPADDDVLEDALATGILFSRY